MLSSARSALVTGASRGIGHGIATMLAGRGYAPRLTAHDEDRLSETADALRATRSPQVETVAGGLADEQLPPRLALAHRTAYGAMSCLVLNAGVGTAVTCATVPSPTDPERGARVMALSSMAGMYAEARLAAYGASKAAVNALVETLNVEESGHGVTATAIAPAYVEPDMSEWIRERIPAAEMIPVADIVALAAAVVDLSARSVVSVLGVTRAGTSGLGA